MHPASSKFRLAIFHLLAIIALATAVATVYFSALAEDQARVHAFRCTFIFHIGGPIVVRTPDDQLHFFRFFAHVDPTLVLFLCAAYDLAWFAGLMLKTAHRFQKKGPRGFEVVVTRDQK